MAKPFPENLRRLHQGEEFIRDRSIALISKSPDLSAHSVLVEQAMDLIDCFSRLHAGVDDDEVTLQLLGIRLFNGTASALKLAMSGYYQTSASQQRDLLETIFLLDYFHVDRTLISVWRKSNKSDRRKRFAPAKVRTTLDDRDGFTERKREQAYSLLSELANHPTSAGFRMLAPVPGSDAHCGPFFEATALKAVFEELTKLAVQAGGIVNRFFKANDKAEYKTKIGFLEAQGDWLKRFYGHDFDRAEIEQMKLKLDRI